MPDDIVTSRLKVVFFSSNSETRRIVETVRMYLQPLGLSDDTRSSVELVLAEALNNVVEHAYADLPGPVELSLSLGDSKVSCTIRDDGAALPHRQVPIQAPSPPESLPEGGFGWNIIRALTCEIAYHREGARNTLSFSIRL